MMAEQVRTAGGLVLLSGGKAGAPDVPARSPLIHIAIYSLLPRSEPPPADTFAFRRCNLSATAAIFL